MHTKAFSGVEFEQRDAFHHFALGFLENFAFFTGERAGDLVGASTGNVGRAPQHPAALRSRSILPTPESCLRGIDGPLNVFSQRGRKLRDHVVGVGGIDIAHQTIRLRMNPFAVNVGTCFHR